MTIWGDSRSGKSVPEFLILRNFPQMCISYRRQLCPELTFGPLCFSWIPVTASISLLQPQLRTDLFLQVQRELLNIKNCVLVILKFLWCFVHRDYSLNIYVMNTWRNLCGAFTWQRYEKNGKNFSSFHFPNSSFALQGWTWKN